MTDAPGQRVSLLTMDAVQYGQGVVHTVVSQAGDAPHQPHSGLSLSNAPAVVTVRLSKKKSHKSDKTKNKAKTKPKNQDQYVWGILSQSVPNTVLLTGNDIKPTKHEKALEDAQKFVEDAIHAPDESSFINVQAPQVTHPKKHHSGQQLALQHELAGLRIDALVSLAAWPDALTHHSGNVLHFGHDNVQSKFWYAVPPERQALVSLRVRAYMLLT